MTVRRQREMTFNANKPMIFECIRRILRSNSTYTNTIESVDGTFFTLVQPNPFFLDTPMTISIEETGTLTTVKVNTKSQPYILGDIFGFYNGYINNFLSALAQEVSAGISPKTNSKSQSVMKDIAGREFACFPAAILVFLVNPAEEVLFLSHPQHNDRWEIVKGAMEAGETIEEAAQRETREEVGADVQVEPVGIVHAATVYHDEKLPCVISLFYLMAYRGGQVQPGDDMAGSQFRWWRLEEIATNKMLLGAPKEKWIVERAIELYRLWKNPPVMK